METQYRTILKKHFQSKRKVNPRYSLRAMARLLQTTPSRLSQILRGKQGLSLAWARRISTRLGMSEAEANLFCTLVEASDSRSKIRRSAALSRLRELQTNDSSFQVLPEDVFQVVSAWYHFAILELTRLKDFEPKPQWIARRLAISLPEVKAALERLERTGLIAWTKRGLQLTHASLSTTVEVPSEAIKKFNSQILQKANVALKSQSVEERDFSTLTVAIKKNQLPEVKERIAAFRRSLNAELERETFQNDADEVYSLAIQFFRLTEKKLTQEKS